VKELAVTKHTVGPAIEIVSVTSPLMPLKWFGEDLGWKETSTLTLSDHSSDGAVRLRWEVALEALKKDKDKTKDDNVSRIRKKKSDGKLTMEAEWSKNQSQIAKFLLHQLDLMTDLCHGRSATQIPLIQERYSFELLFCILNNKDQPPAVRSSSCRLLESLYIQRHPHYPSCGRCEIPFLVWPFKSQAVRFFDVDGQILGDFPTAISKQCSLITDEAMDSLKNFLGEYLIAVPQVYYQDPHRNQLTAAIEDTAFNLLDMGFYNDLPRMQLLAEALRSLLLTSNDILLPDTPVFELQQGAKVKVRLWPKW